MRKIIFFDGEDHAVAAYPRSNRWVLVAGVLACLCLHLLLIIAIDRRTLFVETRPVQEKNNRMEITLIAADIPAVKDAPNKMTPIISLARKEMTIRRQTRRQAQGKSHQFVRVPPSDKSPNHATPSDRHLDLDAIRNNIGQVVAEVDREDSDTPVAQLRNRPLYESDEGNRIARAIHSAIRPDCRDSITNTGLLAPLVILSMALDKKDGGCKW